MWRLPFPCLIIIIISQKVSDLKIFKIISTADSNVPNSYYVPTTYTPVRIS